MSIQCANFCSTNNKMMISPEKKQHLTNNISEQKDTNNINTKTNDLNTESILHHFGIKETDVTLYPSNKNLHLSERKGIDANFDNSKHYTTTDMINKVDINKNDNSIKKRVETIDIDGILNELSNSLYNKDYESFEMPKESVIMSIDMPNVNAAIIQWKVTESILRKEFKKYIGEIYSIEYRIIDVNNNNMYTVTSLHCIRQNHIISHILITLYSIYNKSHKVYKSLLEDYSPQTILEQCGAFNITIDGQQYRITKVCEDDELPIEINPPYVHYSNKGPTIKHYSQRPCSIKNF